MLTSEHKLANYLAEYAKESNKNLLSHWDAVIGYVKASLEIRNPVILCLTWAN